MATPNWRYLLMSPQDPDYPAGYDPDADIEAYEESCILRAERRREKEE